MDFKELVYARQKLYSVGPEERLNHEEMRKCYELESAYFKNHCLLELTTKVHGFYAIRNIFITKEGECNIVTFEGVLIDSFSLDDDIFDEIKDYVKKKTEEIISNPVCKGEDDRWTLPFCISFNLKDKLDSADSRIQKVLNDIWKSFDDKLYYSSEKEFAESEPGKIFLSIPQVKEAIKGMKIDRYIGEYAFLKNSYDAPVQYRGFRFKNSEAAFQAQKTMGMYARDKCEIPFVDRTGEFCALTAEQAKRLGRRIECRPDWDSIKIARMEEIVEAKFMQNPELTEKLLATGDAFMEENTKGDRLWGTVKGQGDNYLGRILMHVRRTIRQK